MASDKLRIQFDLTAKAAEELDALQEMAGARTRGELLRNALRFYAWYLDKTSRGAELVIREGEQSKEVVPLF